MDAEGESAGVSADTTDKNKKSVAVHNQTKTIWINTVDY